MDASPGPLLIVFGGFLGAGKTTTVLRTAQLLGRTGQRVAIITNDQSSDLVDTQVVRRAGDMVVEIPDGCFCCRFDTFQEALDDLLATGRPDVVLAEAVGSCTDLAATVYQPLRQLAANRVALGPLTVVADGIRLRSLVCGEPERLPPTVAYLYERQLAEADVILLNKIDLLTAEERTQIADYLSSLYPCVSVLPISASTGAGLEEWSCRLVPSDTTGERVLDLDYEQYAYAESCLGWMNLTATVLLPRPGSGIEWLRALLGHVAASARSSGSEVAHIKAWVGSDAGTMRGHVVAVDRPIDISLSGSLSQRGRLLINARAPVSPDVLSAWIGAAVRHAGVVADAQVQIDGAACFSPARPEPIHRLLPLAR